MPYGVCVEKWLSAALSIKDKNYGLHGHDYLVKACIEAEKLQGSFLIDHYVLLNLLESCIYLLDHSFLNDVLGDDSPSAEKLAKHIHDCLRRSAEIADKDTVRVEVCTATRMCSYYYESRRGAD